MDEKLTSEQLEALQHALTWGIDDQEHLLRTKSGPLDYAEEWPEVAAKKAECWHHTAEALKKLNGMFGAITRCEKLAAAFLEASKKCE